jgi:hypothetical protein
MKLLLLALVTTLLSVMHSTTAEAMVTLKIYSDLKSTSTSHLFDHYIGGLGNGYVWANGELAAQERPSLFCAPNMALTEANFIAILDKEIAQPTRNKYVDDTPIELILLKALEYLFPCK